MQPELQSNPLLAGRDRTHVPRIRRRMGRAFTSRECLRAAIQSGQHAEKLALKVIDLIRQSTLDVEQLQFEALVQLELITPSTPRMSPAFFENAGALSQSHPGEPR